MIWTPVKGIVHCKKDPYDVYCGRPSIWGNPFKESDGYTREECIDKYREWIKTQPELLAQLTELSGKVLGCWCAPKACHCEVLAELVLEKCQLKLMPHQEEVLNRLSNGKILWGGVGSGKSVTAFAYYMNKELMGEIYVITTAKKRDSIEWQRDAARFGISTDPDCSVAGPLHVDSWNNIGKYVDVKGAFFIFDEQRVVGSGAWVKAFYKIAKNNAWILLSATPGDTWMDYIPVFVANGYYKNATEFKREHVIYRPFTRFPIIDRYVNVPKLEKLKREVLVEMPYTSKSTRHHKEIQVVYDVDLFNRAFKDRWNVYLDKPIRDVSEYFAVMRRIVYSDPSRLEALRELMDAHPKIVVFYNFNYELHILRELNDTWSDMVTISEWNGHRKQPIPDTDRWVYLVQYTAGAEGWNCTETDTMVFYSLPYSYRKWEQAQGRIDRLYTRFSNLFYFSFLSNSLVDSAVKRSLKAKQTFNERKWADENLPVLDVFEVVDR